MWKWLIWAAWLLGFLAACCASVTLCGYWAGVSEWTSWSPRGTIPMALNTATAILALGVGLMIVATVILKTGQSGFPYPLNRQKYLAG